MDSSKVGGRKSSSSSNRGTKMVIAAINIILVLVILGICMLWILLPTNTYKQVWLPKLREKVFPKIFGTQGPTLLIFLSPTLFVAVLSCVYLHLSKKIKENNHQSKNRSHFANLLKKPVLVKGPLGIISWTELAFLLMFFALLIWSFIIYLRISFSKITPQTAAKRGEQLWQSKFRAVVFRLGIVGNIVLAFLFFPVARGSSILPLFGLTSEASIKYHIWLGNLAMILFTSHGLGYIFLWATTDHLYAMLKWQNTGVVIMAGEISLLAGLVLWATTLPRTRRKSFELFFYTHHFYIPFVFFYIIHVGFNYTCISLPSFYLFFLDRFLRFLQSSQSVRLVSTRILPCQTFELNFSKNPGLSYNPTSIMFVNVPIISKIQWHPFTITSNSNLEPDRLSVVIKCEGSWSTKFHDLLSTSSIEHLDVSVEGPYGPTSTHLLRHDTLVLISGGSGITPFISIIREMIFLSSTLQCKTPKILLICSFKNSSSLTMLDLVLPMSSNSTDFSNLQLEIQAYVTREKAPTIENSPIQTKFFKPNAFDAPISATLGPNSWLWLAVIISSSLVIFLILIGIITHYYIYPIDQNAKKKFSTTLRCVLNMLCICISVSMSASAAVYWNKKQNSKKTKQIENVEGPTPITSPDSEFHNGDRELESYPQQSLVQVTEVHYGGRPDLKRILLECKGSSVGVFGSGPKNMRHELAAICSSGLADNLHFESISFTW